MEIRKSYYSVIFGLTVENHNKKEYKNKIGVDLNIKYNLATVGNPKTNEVNFLGKDFIYRRVKYKAIRQRWKKQGILNKIKQN
jgi:transposase